MLDELRALHTVLQADGLTCALYTLRDVLLIGTPGGGIITVGLASDRSSWWGNSVIGCVNVDLTGVSVTAAVHAEVDRHEHLAAQAQHSDALLRDAQLLEGIA